MNIQGAVDHLVEVVCPRPRRGEAVGSGRAARDLVAPLFRPITVRLTSFQP